MHRVCSIHASYTSVYAACVMYRMPHRCTIFSARMRHVCVIYWYGILMPHVRRIFAVCMRHVCIYVCIYTPYKAASKRRIRCSPSTCRIGAAYMQHLCEFVLHHLCGMYAEWRPHMCHAYAAHLLHNCGMFVAYVRCCLPRVVFSLHHLTILISSGSVSFFSSTFSRPLFDRGCEGVVNARSLIARSFS